MKPADIEKLILGLECCLGIDTRRCSACPFKRHHGQDDGKCAERLMRASLVLAQMQMIAKGASSNA